MSKQSLRLIGIIVAHVFSLISCCAAFLYMGQLFYVWFLIAAIGFFIPYILVVATFIKRYPHSSGFSSWIATILPERSAFILSCIWYWGYLLWAATILSKSIFPCVYFVFGNRALHNPPTILLQPLGIICVAFVLLILLTILLQRGRRQVLLTLSRTSTLFYLLCGFFLIAIIALILKPTASQAISHTVTNQTLPFYASLNFAITAFGGIDTIATMLMQTSTTNRRRLRYLITSGAIIVTLYFFAIISLRVAIPISALEQSYPSLHLGNIIYVMTDYLARELAIIIHVSPTILAAIAIRFAALVMLSTYIGLLALICYTPIKSLRDQFSTNRKFTQKHSYFMQAAIIGLLLLLGAFPNAIAQQLFLYFTHLTNFFRTIPYFALLLLFFIKRKALISFSILPKRLMYAYSILAIAVCLLALSGTLSQLYSSHGVLAIICLAFIMVAILVGSQLLYFYLRKEHA